MRNGLPRRPREDRRRGRPRTMRGMLHRDLSDPNVRWGHGSGGRARGHGGPPRPPPAPAPPPPSPSPTTAASKPAGAGAGKPLNPFLAQDPRQKARRLARALISDMIVYQPDKRQQALKAGNLKEAFDEEIKKSWEE